jgi:hypothetical protein
VGYEEREMIHRGIRQHVAALLKLAPLSVSVVLIGCGGGGGGAGASGSGSQSNGHIGPTQVTYFGKPQAAIEGVTNQVTYDGQAGASYTSLSIDPAPSLNNTFLAFTRAIGSSGDEIYTIPASGNGSPSLLTHASVAGYPSFTQGSVICFLTAINNNYSVEQVLSDGTQEKVLIANQQYVPTISPNGQTIAYLDSAGNIWTVPAAGGTAKEIYAGGNANAYPVIWSPNSSQLAFTATNTTTSSYNVYTVAATGGTPSNVTPTAQQTGSMIVSGWSPDSQSLACSYEPMGGTTVGLFILSISGGANLQPTPTGFNDTSPCISPDGFKLAFYRSSAGGATPGIYESDFAGSNPVLVVADPTSNGGTGPVQTLVWSPFPENIKYVGSGGTLSSGPIAGFLTSQNAGRFASMLTFAATTPSTATLTSPAGTGGLFFNLGADSITNITYTNAYNGSHTSVSLTSTPSAVVSLDPSSGLVQFIAPGKFGKKVPTPSKGGGGISTFSGAFTAIYDSTGKNLAPSGATSIQADPTTGKLISFR